MSENNKRSLLNAIAGPTLIIALSKLVGLGREMVVAGTFGAGVETDAYNAAWSLFYLPVLLFSSSLRSTMVPQYLRAREELGEEGAVGFSGGVLTVFCVLAAAVAAVLFALAGPLVRMIYPGFSAKNASLTAKLLRIMLPALMFFVSAMVMSYILDARSHHVAAQLSGFALSFAEIFAVFTFSRQLGIRSIAWAVIGAGLIQVIVLIPYFRGKYLLRPCWNAGTPRFRGLIRNALPAIVNMAVMELNHFIDRMLASGLNEGDITSMSNAFKLIMVIEGIVVVPLTSVSFTRMSAKAVKNVSDQVIPEVRNSFQILLSVILPITILVAVQSRDIVRLFFGRGAFTEENVIVTGQLLLFYVLGLPFIGLRDIASHVFSAFSDNRTPRNFSILAVAVNITLNLILRRFMGANGLALATGIAALVNFAGLLICMRKLLPGLLDRKFLLRLLVICAICVPVLIVSIHLYGIFDRIYGPAKGTIGSFVRLCEVSGVGFVLYLVLLLLTGGRDTLRKIVRKFKKR